MRLGAFLMSTGHHVAAWRHQDAAADAGANLAHMKSLVQLAEAAKFDMVFMADSDGAWFGTDAETVGRSHGNIGFEPLTLWSAMAAVSERIGFAATVSTTYNEPWHVARKFASLDLLSGGRAAWNVVTSGNSNAALNFSLDEHPDHAVRYRRATEFLDVVLGLWNTWDDDAFIRDKAAGRFFQSDKLQVLNHVGEFYRVRGPLTVPRSPQGHPVVVQAGSSEPGKELAARTAEVVFTAQTRLEDAQAFYADVKGRMARYNRHPDHLKIMPGIFPVVGATQAEADAKYQALQDLIHPAVGLAMLSGMAGGLDLSGFPLDGPVPQDLPVTEANKSRQRLLLDLAARENLTIRQLYLRIAGARGHWTVVGTPAAIADEMEAWFRGGGADGFNVMPPVLPTGLEDFVNLVLPELRRRGLFRTEYEGRTLRENLGLPFPARVPQQRARVA
jgi:FMN-dependent oxidoreductase (nitrilotriacetate monooxygenase family)